MSSAINSDAIVWTATCEYRNWPSFPTRALYFDWKPTWEDQKKIVDFYKSGLSLGAISKQLQTPRASVQTIICKYKAFGSTETLQRSGRKRKLTTKDEQILVRKVKLNPKTTKKDMIKELAMSDIKV